MLIMCRSQHLWPIFDSLSQYALLIMKLLGKCSFWTTKQAKLFLICVNIQEAGDNQFSSTSKKSKGQVLGGIMESLWGKKPNPPQALSGTSPAFFHKPLVGVLCLEPPWLAIWGTHCTAYHQAASLKCQILFIDLTILCYLQQATEK